jgi:hypothetical protein
VAAGQSAEAGEIHDLAFLSLQTIECRRGDLGITTVAACQVLLLCADALDQALVAERDGVHGNPEFVGDFGGIFRTRGGGVEAVPEDQDETGGVAGCGRGLAAACARAA